jgi:hypothetical protein
MTFAYSLLVLTLATNLLAQSPIRETLAYSRNTTRGIPAGPNRDDATQPPIKVDYYLYVVVRKGVSVSASTACVRGKSFTATLKKVDAPVLIEHDATIPTGSKDTLVKPTADDVYQIILSPQGNPPCEDPEIAKLTRNHEVVVPLKSGQSIWYSLADNIISLRAAAGS